MKTIALYNLKGGVGKTAAAVNLSYLAAGEGRATLLVDLDPQGAASFYFRVRTPKGLRAKKLLGGNAEEFIRGTNYPSLDLLPSDLSFRNISRILDRAKHPKRQLKSVIKPFKHEFDYVFIDCPPGISLEAENVFQAAHLLLVPVIPSTLSMNSFDTIRSFFQRKGLNQEIITPFFSMVDRRKKLHISILEKNITPKGQFLTSHIPFSSLVEQMGVTREPVCATSPNSAASKAFENLWQQAKRLAAL